jgi:competence protein ComEC
VSSGFFRQFIKAHFGQEKLKKLVVGFWLIGVSLLVYIFYNLPDGNLHIFFLDVGQGDSIFIQTPTNQKILIDGGPDERVLSYLGRVLPFYDRTLDLVVLTHPHADHVAGLIEVVRRYQVNMVLANKTEYLTPEMKAFWEAVQKKRIKIRQLTMGEQIKLESIKLDCFWPPGGRVETSSSNPNLDSIVLLLNYGDFSALFTGDAEEVVQQQLILLNKMAPKTTILKVPHQGAEDCCDEEFIKLLKPQLAVVSVGCQNRFGHPSLETINKLESLNIKVLRTDQEGTIEVVSDGKSWWVKTAGK